MPLLNPAHPTSARVAACCILYGPTSWWILEYIVSRGYYPSYSYFGNFTSDLAVPYPFTERNGRRVNSTRASLMKFNIYTKALVFIIGHAALLRASGKRDSLTIARGIFIAIYAFGTVLLGKIPGGPREHENGMVFWHTIGGAMSMWGGNISSILAGVADPDPFYRRACILFGTSGLVNSPIFVLKGKTPVKGLWQRGVVYPIQLWEFLTAYTLWSQLLRPPFRTAVS